MPTEETKKLLRRWGEVWTEGKTAALTGMDEICSPDILFHAGIGRDIRGLEGSKQYTSEFYDAFPDAQFTLNDVIVEGDKGVLRYTVTGTSKGAVMGISPNNKKVRFWVIEIDRFAGGKLVECWVRFDTLNLMQQLGAVPAPKK